jgi:hypothetical protein
MEPTPREASKEETLNEELGKKQERYGRPGPEKERPREERREGVERPPPRGTPEGP